MDCRLILVGAGDFGRELINWVEDAADSGVDPRFSGFIDANALALNNYGYRLPWLGTPDEFIPLAGDQFVLGIANPDIKRRIVEMLRAKNAVFARFIHPSAVIAKTAILGEGVVICPHALISSDANLGAFVAVNGLSSVGHDARIGDYSTLSAHVDITGFVQVGEGVFLGTGAKVIPRVKLGSWSKIGAGTTILRSVPEGAVMYAMPARRL